MFDGPSVRQVKAFFDAMDAEPGALLSMKDFSSPETVSADGAGTTFALRADFYSDANVVACLISLDGSRPGWVTHHVAVPGLDRSDEFEIAVTGAAVGIASAFTPGNLYYHKSGSVFLFGANAYFEAMFCIRGNTTHTQVRNYTFEAKGHFIDLGRPELRALENRMLQYDGG